jgi:hypothetical protein
MNSSIIFWLVGCFQPETTVNPADVDASSLQNALPFTDPIPLIDIENTLRSKIPMSPQCPSIHTIDNLEIWQADCELRDGHRLEGELRFEIDTSPYLVEQGDTIKGRTENILAENFHYTIDGETTLYLDGHIQFWSIDRLLRMEQVLNQCGLYGDGCTEPISYTDMVASIYPSDSPSYDVTVSGLVLTDSPILIDGTWHIDPTACPTEASSGMIAVQHTNRHDIILDGAISCDGCADWSIEGSSVGPFCSFSVE